MLFAFQMSDNVQLAIIGFAAMALKEYFDWSRANKQAKLLAENQELDRQHLAKVAVKTEEVAVKQDKAAELVAQVATDLVTVRDHTNGMMKLLQATSRQEGYDEGVKDERATSEQAKGT